MYHPLLDVPESGDEQVPAEDGAVDGRHLAFVELVDGDGVEVAQEARRDGVAAAARRSHRRHQLHVGQVDRRRVLQVVPVQVSPGITRANSASYPRRDGGGVLGLRPPPGGPIARSHRISCTSAR